MRAAFGFGRHVKNFVNKKALAELARADVL